MRRSILLLPALTCLASAFLIDAFPFRSSLAKDQRPMMEQGPGPVLPSLGDDPQDNNGSPGSIIIADVLGRDRSINIFASLARDVDTVAQRFQKQGLNTTVLAPSNSAMTKLPRKPWEDAEDYKQFGTNAYQGTDGESRAHRNMQRFIEAHAIPMSPWTVGEKTETMAGTTIWFEEKEGKKFIQPGDVEVQSVAEKVSNGEIWILKNVLNYAS